MSKPLSTEAKFWNAITSQDGETAVELLKADSSLAGKNFLSESLHNDGFPLYHAAQQGNLQLVKQLLDHGADPNANLESDDPREYGMPLMNAFHGGHLDVIHFLLDHNPQLNAATYCGTPFVDCLFNATWEHPQFQKLVGILFSNSFLDYFPSREPTSVELPQDAPEILKILHRVIAMGGQPSLFTVVRHQQHELIERLLKTCPEEPGTPLDWPRGSVFSNICNAANWLGYPKTLEHCRSYCPSHFSPNVAKCCINRAIRSHNRDGSIDEYFGLIESQLEFLKSRDQLEPVFEDGSPFTPLHILAEDFLESANYGFKCENLSSAADLIRLAKLFIKFGFDSDYKNPISGMKPLQVAKENGQNEYVDFLSGRKEQA